MAEREIKFRGLKTFQIFTGETKQVWIYGFYLKRGTYGDPGPQAHIFVYENGYEGYRVDSKTIGQFTGYFDRDNVEIYEDDIISFGEQSNLGVVENFKGAFVVRCGNEKSPRLLGNLVDKAVKVMGNRFENPQLLIKKKRGARK
ncbi:MAG: hypothetical protein IJU71_12245 [Selenomonadaceae bacterium]|nr:hypothetical protein [Selenomonadaceae bacterium]